MEIITLMIVVCYALAIATAKSAPQKQGLQSLKLEKTLSVERESDFLISPNGTFTSGFYRVGENAYCYSIWFTNSADKTVVWMANRDIPVNGKKSQLQLHRNGNLALLDGFGSIIWETKTKTKTFSKMVQLQLLENGNLVLANQQGDFLWQSFDFPTNTLLPTQQLDKNTTLVSMRGKGIYLSGYYNYKFNDNNVLNLIYNSPLVTSVYWPSTDQTIFYFHRTPYNSTRVAAINVLGRFKSSDNLKFNASDYGFGPKRRLTLDYDGMLRLYSLDNTTGLWRFSWWNDGVNQCEVHGQCGAYGICSYEPLPTCSCPYGFVWNDPTDWSEGCKPNFNMSCGAEVDFIIEPNTDYYGYDLNTFGVGLSLESCRNACLNDCKCLGFAYAVDGSGECYPKRSLLNGKRLSTINRVMHFKVPREIALISGKVKARLLDCSSPKNLVFGAGENEDDAKRQRGYFKYLIAFVGSFGIIEVICVGLAWWFVFRKSSQEELVNMGYVVLALGFKRFAYSELRKATMNFKQEIGKGGFGTVYKGILENGRVIAVKKLEGILQGDAEFWAEVSIIGKLNHKNLVKMWGFCAENEHKMLVYEYMENGSLDKLLFSDLLSSTLTWEQRYNIALGTAKGLSYIHEECLEWVLHCDVKPQNILLDTLLEPKVADFGMSKLFKENQDSGFSRVRGTRGYLAPEWMMNLNVDAKADVYSYGIVLLELLTGERACGFQLNSGNGVECKDLVSYAREKINEGKLEEVTDPRLEFDRDNEKLERLVRVCLLCVCDDRGTRPAMSKVAKLLSGYEQCPESNVEDSETDDQ